jgi:hypothetical protein
VDRVYSDHRTSPLRPLERRERNDCPYGTRDLIDANAPSVSGVRADPGVRSVLVEGYDDFAGLGVVADVFVSGDVFSQTGENAIDGGLEDS